MYGSELKRGAVLGAVAVRNPKKGAVVGAGAVQNYKKVRVRVRVRFISN